MAFAIKSGKTFKAIKTVIYGPEGVGKTTLAASFPKPIFIDTEGSTTHFDVQRFEPSPRTWTELKQMVDYVATTDFKTLVIDTFDWAEAAEVAELCREQKAKSIEGIPYGKGYTMSAERIQDFLKSNLDPLIEKGINVVIVCHSMTRDFQDPMLDKAYQRYELKLGSKTQTKTAALIKEWADNVFFCNYETYIESGEALGAKTKGKGGKTRVMYTEHDAAFDAKNRFSLERKLPMSIIPISHIFGPTEQDEKPKAQEVKVTPKPAPQTAAPAQPAEDNPVVPYAVVEISAQNGYTAKDIQRMLFTLGVAKKLDCNLVEVPDAFWKSYISEFHERWQPLMEKAKQENVAAEPDIDIAADDLPF